MGTFKRKDTIFKKLESDDLRVHTGVRKSWSEDKRKKKTSATPKPSSWFQRLIGVVIDWMGKRG